MRTLLRTLWDSLPLGTHRRGAARALRKMLPTPLAARYASSNAMAREVQKLEIHKAGQAPDGTCLIQLANGRVFHGFSSQETEESQYALWPKSLRDTIPEPCARVAIDIVCRYIYPHADVTARPPYPQRDLRAFHPQHHDTLDDIHGLSDSVKNQLRTRFLIRPGDCILDIGGFIGFGAMRLSEMVGDSGRVLSVEAHPQNQQLFERNMMENELHNVQLIRAGVWNRPGSFMLQCDRLQQNSLVDDIIQSGSQIEVPTNTVDNLVETAAWTKLAVISLTINAAEIEAVEGMQQTLERFSPCLTIAGWYLREGRPVHEHLVPMLRDFRYETVVGPVGRIYAWPRDGENRSGQRTPE